MAMTVSECNHLNTLLKWAAGQPAWPGGPQISDEDATAAGRFLAGRAVKVLGAGIRPEEITFTLTRARIAEEFRCSRCGHVHDEEFICEQDCLTCALKAERAEDEDATPEGCEQ